MKIKKHAKKLVKALNRAEDYGDFEPVMHRDVKKQLYKLQKKVNKKKCRDPQ